MNSPIGEVAKNPDQKNHDAHNSANQGPNGPHCSLSVIWDQAWEWIAVHSHQCICMYTLAEKVPYAPYDIQWQVGCHVTCIYTLSLDTRAHFCHFCKAASLAAGVHSIWCEKRDQCRIFLPLLPHPSTTYWCLYVPVCVQPTMHIYCMTCLL